MRIADEFGGSLTIEYETFKLGKKEAFLVFIDSKEVLSVTRGDQVDDLGFSI